MLSRIVYPFDPAQEVRLYVETLRPFLTKLLVKRSMFQYDADTVIGCMLDADLRDNPAYGCARVSDVLAAIDAGDIDPRGRILTFRETPALAVLDGSRAAGPVAGIKGIEIAIAKARAVGVGTVAIGNSQPLGAAGIYAMVAAREGLIGQCITSTGKASISAPGLTSPVVGNTAVAWAIPCGPDCPPIVFDSACGAGAWGKLGWLKKYGLPIPDDILNPAATGDEFAAPAMLPAGGALGFGMSLVASLLAGPLCGGKTPIHKKRTNTADDSQHFLQAIDISQFVDPARFHKEIQTSLADIRGAAAKDSQTVHIPGSHDPDVIERNLREGIRLHNSDWQAIQAWATKLRVEIPV